MKLFEIIDTQVKKVTTKSPISGELFHKRFGNKQDRILGTGLSGAAISKPSDPHVIIKTNRTQGSLEKDGYYTYINAVVEGKLAADNTYFPRVYKMTTAEDYSKYGIYHIETETLMHESNIDDADALSLVQRVLNYGFFANHYFDIDANFTRRGSPIDDREVDAAQMAFWLVFAINRYIRRKERHYIRDPKLIEALDIISNIKEKAPIHFGWDLHTNNIMYRRGPYLQVVITDPLS